MLEFLGTTDHQLGFKQGLSTISCVFGLKKVINYFRDLTSCMFTCFLDFKSAIDRVSLYKLFSKLIDRGVPSYLVVFTSELV